MKKVNAKLAIRIAVLTAVMLGTFVAASFEPVPAADGGPIIICPPKQAGCQSTLPT